MTDEQLEDILAKRKLEREQQLLQQAAHVDTIQAKETSLEAVGPLLSLKVKIEGLEVDAMVDTSSRSTVISRFNAAQDWKTFEIARKRFPKTKQTSFTFVWKRWLR